MLILRGSLDRWMVSQGKPTFFDVVLEQIAESLPEPSSQNSQFPLEGFFIEHLAEGDTVTCRHGAVGRANATCIHQVSVYDSRKVSVDDARLSREVAPFLLTLGGANIVAGKFLLLEAIDADMQVGDDVAAIREQDTLRGMLEALLNQGVKLLEEGGNVNNGARADNVQAARIHKAGSIPYVNGNFRAWHQDLFKCKPVNSKDRRLSPSNDWSPCERRYSRK